MEIDLWCSIARSTTRIRDEIVSGKSAIHLSPPIVSILATYIFLSFVVVVCKGNWWCLYFPNDIFSVLCSFNGIILCKSHLMEHYLKIKAYFFIVHFWEGNLICSNHATTIWAKRYNPSYHQCSLSCSCFDVHFLMNALV